VRQRSLEAAPIQPSRSVLKRAIRSLRTGSDGQAIGLLVLDLTLLVAAFLGSVLADSFWLRLAAGTVVGIAIARLFVIGHDACHQSFVADRRWNQRIGRIAFLPSLTNYGLWESGHNLGHHVFTNLRGRDYVWTPFTKAEFDALPVWRRGLERIYRSGFGYGLYYLIELWWKHLFLPPTEALPGANRRTILWRDLALLTAFLALWIAAIAAAAATTGAAPWSLYATGLLWPFLVWSTLMGAAIYFHHTHPALVWYQDPEAWEASRDGVSTTVHVTFPARLGWLINEIMAHPAHHLDVRIPLFNLARAQAVLVAEGAGVLEQPFSLRYVRDAVRRCKLYDYDARRWMDFSGRYTTP
jgi:omega-6 fatty acid desaturase (delta-12 desaturase)